MRPPRRVRPRWLGRCLSGVWTCLGMGTFGCGATPWGLETLTWGAGGGRATAGPYALIDTVGQSALGTVTAFAAYRTIGGFWPTLNTPPAAGQDTVVRAAGRTAKMQVSALLGNDGDDDGDGLALARFDAAASRGGRVVMDNGWLLYLPPTDTDADDDFTYTVTDSEGATATGTVRVTRTQPVPGVPRTVVRLEASPDGTRSVWFVGIPGRLYAVQATESLVAPAWVTLRTQTAGGNGLIAVVDATVPLPAQRYYRAVMP